VPQPFHVYPLSAGQSDLAHESDARLVRDRAEQDCPLCQVGRCWQEVRREQGTEVVVHGVNMASKVLVRIVTA